MVDNSDPSPDPDREVKVGVSTLTKMQRTALEKFLASPSRTLTEAARMAGYKHPNKAAYKLKNHPAFQTAVEEFFHDQNMEAREAVAILSSHARGSLGDFITITSEGSFTFDLNKASEADVLHLVRTLKKTTTTRTSKDGEDYVTTREEVGLYSSQDAAQLILKYLGGIPGDDGDTYVPAVRVILPDNGRLKPPEGGE